MKDVIEAVDKKLLEKELTPERFLRKTNNGGNTWQHIYSDSSQFAFYNAIDFWNSEEGIAFGDPPAITEIEFPSMKVCILDRQL